MSLALPPTLFLLGIRFVCLGIIYATLGIVYAPLGIVLVTQPFVALIVYLLTRCPGKLPRTGSGATIPLRSGTRRGTGCGECGVCVCDVCDMFDICKWNSGTVNAQLGRWLKP